MAKNNRVPEIYNFWSYLGNDFPSDLTSKIAGTGRPISIIQKAEGPNFHYGEFY